MVLPEKLIDFSLSNNILWSKVSKASQRSIKSYQYIFHLQHRLKLYPLTETNMYVWNSLL